MPLTCVLVDDERLARENMRMLLRPYDGIEIVGEADSVETAVQLIESCSPQLVFLDIQMAGGSGFDVLERLEQTPSIVFVTAHDRHAIRAFEVNAIDYLLKPVAPKRLDKALQRLLNPAAAEEMASRPLKLTDRIYIDTGQKKYFVPLNSLLSICSNGDYSTVHTTNGADMLVRRSMKDWEALLPAKHFARIHRSVIINLNQVAMVERLSGDRLRVQLCGDGSTWDVSRRRAAKLANRLAACRK